MSVGIECIIEECKAKFEVANKECALAEMLDHASTSDRNCVFTLTDKSYNNGKKVAVHFFRPKGQGWDWRASRDYFNGPSNIAYDEVIDGETLWWTKCKSHPNLISHNSLTAAVEAGFNHIMINGRIDPPVNNNVFGAFPCQEINIYQGPAPAGCLFVSAACKVAWESVGLQGATITAHEKEIKPIIEEVIRLKLTSFFPHLAQVSEDEDNLPLGRIGAM